MDEPPHQELPHTSSQTHQSDDAGRRRIGKECRMAKKRHLDKGGLASATVPNEDQLEGRHVFPSCHLDPSFLATLQLCNGRLECSGNWWQFAIKNNGIWRSLRIAMDNGNRSVDIWFKLILSQWGRTAQHILPEKWKCHARTWDTVNYSSSITKLW